MKKNPGIENNWGTKRCCAMKIAVLTRHGEQAPMPSRQVCCATTRKQFGLACVESATSAVAAVRRRWPGTRLRGVAAQLTKCTHNKKKQQKDPLQREKLYVPDVRLHGWVTKRMTQPVSAAKCGCCATYSCCTVQQTVDAVIVQCSSVPCRLHGGLY